MPSKFASLKLSLCARIYVHLNKKGIPFVLFFKKSGLLWYICGNEILFCFDSNLTSRKAIIHDTFDGIKKCLNSLIWLNNLKTLIEVFLLRPVV